MWHSEQAQAQAHCRATYSCHGRPQCQAAGTDGVGAAELPRWDGTRRAGAGSCPAWQEHSSITTRCPGFSPCPAQQGLRAQPQGFHWALALLLK